MEPLNEHTRCLEPKDRLEQLCTTALADCGFRMPHPGKEAHLSILAVGAPVLVSGYTNHIGCSHLRLPEEA